MARPGLRTPPPSPLPYTCIGIRVQADVQARVGGKVVAVGGHEGHQVDAAGGDAFQAEQVEEVRLCGRRGRWAVGVRRRGQEVVPQACLVIEGGGGWWPCYAGHAGSRWAMPGCW